MFISFCAKVAEWLRRRIQDSIHNSEYGFDPHPWQLFLIINIIIKKILSILKVNETFLYHFIFLKFKLNFIVVNEKIRPMLENPVYET